MKISLNPRILFAVLLGALAIAALGVLVFGFAQHRVSASGQNINCIDFPTATSARNGCAQGPATTTPLYLTSATTTLPAFNVNAAAGISLNVAQTSSTTASALLFTIQYSYNGVDWYGEDTNTTSGTVITHGVQNAYHVWIPGATATTSRSFALTFHDAKFARLNFQAAAANAAIYPQVMLQNLPTQ